MFQEVGKADFVGLERQVLSLWRSKQIFQKSLNKPAPKGHYVFYEGPPTANGKPGIHHVISRCYKDLFPRFKTMQGYRVGRKGGWDTHGLPVEIEIEKKLGLSGKQDIERYGIAPFNKLAKESVFSNIQDWNEMTERIGFWVDLDDAYVTYHNEYIESCWWVMKSLWERGLLFEDYKVTMHCPRCNTSLASHEVAQGYQDNVDDPSVWPKFPVDMAKAKAMGLVDDDTCQVYIMAWTTTPWTLPANTGLAVKADASYSLLEAPSQHGSEDQDLFIIATVLADKTFGEGNYQSLRSYQGSDLVGLSYQPILQGFSPSGEDLSNGYRVIADNFVEVAADAEGTGVVHIAPAYGDLDIGKTYGLPTLFSVDLMGNVYEAVRPLDMAEGSAPYAGQFFKEADKAITRDLMQRKLMYKRARIKHTYPFCWRCKTPLLFYAKTAWYLRTTAVRDKLISNNQDIFWVPEHIRDGRFGKWLENNIDWALSRERYWGCPLPMWLSEDGEQHCVGSLKELSELTGRDLSDLELHRPYVDDISFEKNGKVFKRVPYTVDVWFESGAMPYAQWHYLGENSTPEAKANFEANFPADYICEAIDQTRGWFYSLHALSTLLTYGGDESIPPGPLAHLAKDTSSFKHVICLGHILDEKGEKMSKSKGNIVEPETVLSKQGADALRWYLYAAAPPGNSRRFSEALVDESIKDFFLTLWNTYSFFVLYANLDKPNLNVAPPVSERSEIDRWLTARLHQLVKEVTEGLELYDPTPVCRMIRDFVVDELSNWYVRRSRRRFWKSESDSDKVAAYRTLYDALVTVSKLIAPMAPFISETIYQNLVLSVDETAPESVHLAAWPIYEASLIDEALLRDMKALLKLIELGRSARNASGHKVRQPLPEVLVRVSSNEELEGMKRFETQILEELNVKKVIYLDIAADFVSYSLRPNLPLVGKRLGKHIPEFRQKLLELDGKMVARNIREGRDTFISVGGEEMPFEPEAFLLDAKSPEGYSAAEHGGYLAALNTSVTPALIQEGLMRDVVRFVQDGRKNAGLEVSDMIHLSLVATGELAEAIRLHAETIKKEVLAQSLNYELGSGYQEEVNINDSPLKFSIEKLVSLAK
ncbi:MAG: isoleucine--tRNA ligase [Deinococcales bacterium]